MTKTASMQTVFLVCQVVCIAFALPLEGRAEEPFWLLSFFFNGANLGALVYGWNHGKEVD